MSRELAMKWFWETKMYKPKAGDRVEFVGADWYGGPLQPLRPGDKGTVQVVGQGKASILCVAWDNWYICIPPWSLCRLLDKDAEEVFPLGEWIDACLVFRSAGGDLGRLACNLHRKHVELFPVPCLPQVRL